ncbi:hypothetical protein NT6N_07240 [Oceaniferula spumae]|uniref:General secretion pathway protein GspM n=1 Tax=Oceaniferula spumae TaxID=2979115 RepID=A0AAT9FI74_9BACT
MNDREKKLIFLLFGAAFIIVNLFLYTSYTAAKQKKEIALDKGAKEIALKEKQLLEADERIAEMNWLIDYAPKEGTHAAVRADLVTFAEQSAQRNGITMKKRPVPVREEAEPTGAYHIARVKVLVNARDPEFYRWITELQNPEKSRSVTMLRISPQRDDPTRIDCELEITQWFAPAADDLLDDNVTAN